MTAEDRKLCVQIVAQILLSDMALTESESVFLDEVSTRFGFDHKQCEQLVSSVNIHDPILERVAQLSPAAHPVLLELVEAAAQADGVIEPMEAKLLGKIRASLQS